MRARVIQHRYWNIADIPLVVNEWPPETALDPPDLSAMLIWIDLKGVPSLMFSHRALKCLSRAAGKFVKLHPSTEKCTRLDVARVLVEVNLHEPLVEKISCLDKDGGKVLIDVVYPWLPPKCNVCAAWGHKGNCCSSKTIKVLQEGKEKEVLGDLERSEVVIHGGDKEAHEVNTNRKVVNEVFLEISQGKLLSKSPSSPPKYGKQSTEAGEDQGDGGIIISPSRFSVLALEGIPENDKNEDSEEDDLEEGEVNVEERMEDAKIKEPVKNVRLRASTSFKLSKQIPVRANSKAVKPSTNPKKASDRKL
ncbi:hypothetical protein F2Q69_00054411 [Brassica cretica]|uniref:DUF4283 domain-containing protein n=1 Tax=Brassica cretica TaxID=69181 RepID=A0A8S9N6S1_BRACR|nr:hypothetical protein F2Q69_00054411 [Brassica cretica]